ncbi:MAG: UvrD-helicase domain-containing protein [Ruminococcus sp.]
MAWTEQQSEAITTRDCGLIVSAAAGSGKTSFGRASAADSEDETPEHRVPADRMIVVTFTNDAAAEMRSRLYQALDDQLQKQPENQWLYQQQVRLQNAHICTISSFCLI